MNAFSPSKTLRQTNIVFLRRGEEVLLAMKKRGFGQGRWNGAGGKPEVGETIEQAAIRECQEELGVTPTALRHVATLDFRFPAEKAAKGWDQQVLVYFCEQWHGEPTESDEMAPRWFKTRDIPYDEMWADDKYWYPLVLDGKFVAAEFHFGDDDEVLSQTISTTDLS